MWLLKQEAGDAMSRMRTWPDGFRGYLVYSLWIAQEPETVLPEVSFMPWQREKTWRLAPDGEMPVVPWQWNAQEPQKESKISLRFWKG